MNKGSFTLFTTDVVGSMKEGPCPAGAAYGARNPHKKEGRTDG